MLKLLKKLQRDDLGRVLLCIVFIVGQVFLDLKLPDYMADVTTLVKTPGSALSEIYKAGALMLGCALGSMVMSVIVGFFAAKVAARFSKTLRACIFGQVQSFSMEEISSFSTASLITRSTNDITQIQMLIALGLQMMIKAPIMAVMAVGKIATKNWQWTALTAGMVMFLLITIALIMRYALPRFNRTQKLTDDLNLVARENLTGIRVVHAYNAEDYQQNKFERANEAMTSNLLSAQRAMTFINPAMTLVLNGLTLGIYWIGAYLISASALQMRIEIFSDMVVFSSYAMQVIMSFMMLTMIFIMLPRAQVSARRIGEVLSTKTKILDGPILPSAEKGPGSVVFKDVSFKYPDADDYVLEHISFSANPGETVAFIGSTGSGKSTLINLVARFFDVSEGSVEIDGKDVREYSLEALHDKLGYVSQRAVLFQGTVSSNVTYGKYLRFSPTKEDIAAAVRVAQAEEFVKKMPDTYDAFIAPQGTNVSGGQKQRLAIARAVCRDAEIYIFDDSFSALDYRTDRILRQALNKEMSGATKLIVAQRIATIKDADKIVVLDSGRIVGMGTHQELLKTCDVYMQIASSQLSKEELEK